MGTSPDDLEATDDLQPEYDFRSLRGVVRGKYAARHQEMFGDPLSVTGYDPRHDDDKDRFLTMGMSVAGRLLVASHTDRGDTVRIISTRLATRRERKDYEDGNFP
jgi:uncharacterized protein